MGSTIICLPKHLIAEDPMPNAKPYVLVQPRARHIPDLGALTTMVSPQCVDSVLTQHGVVTQRLRGMPMHLLVYFLLAMVLFPSLPYGELQARLEGGWLLPRSGPWRKLTSSAISHARERLPWQVMEALFLTLAMPGYQAGSGRWRGFRVVAIDGSSMEMAVSDANEAAFAGPVGKDRRRVGDPQLRLVTLVDCWTRAALGAVMAGFDRGEGKLAVELVDKICSGMLVLADRGFVGVELISKIRGAGGEVLWRVKKGVAARPLAQLTDGSYLATMRPRSVNGERLPSITVRVIEFKLQGRLHRLLTTLLDPTQAPARELISLYSKRWQIETFYRECKGDEQGRRRALRSRTSMGVKQEIWATLIVHLLVRELICWVVAHGPVDDPKLISYKHATAFIREHLQSKQHLSRKRWLGWAVAALTQSAALLRPPPKPRSNPRQVKAAPIRYRVRDSAATVLTTPFDPSSIEIQQCLTAA
jgi:Insertion element 4 transposase N-terminal/Transposase DDE domain